jgi:hypothetical protein
MPASVSRRWIGNQDGNNNASNPDNWSSTGVPRRGDTLTMSQGVMHISGHDLAGDTLSVSGNVEISTYGRARLDLHATDVLTTVDVKVHDTLELTADTVGLFGSNHLNLAGGTIKFIGSSNFSGSTQVFNDRLLGSGTVSLSGANLISERMEINGEVGAGLTFNVATAGPPDVSLRIDNPRQFHALIDIPALLGPPSGVDVAFMGLRATSGDLRDDILRIFDGKKLVDTVRLNPGSPASLKLEQNSQGVMLSQGNGDSFQPGGAGVLLPLKITA